MVSLLDKFYIILFLSILFFIYPCNEAKQNKFVLLYLLCYLHDVVINSNCLSFFHLDIQSPLRSFGNLTNLFANIKPKFSFSIGITAGIDLASRLRTYLARLIKQVVASVYI